MSYTYLNREVADVESLGCSQQQSPYALAIFSPEENSMIPHRMKFTTCPSACLSQLSGQIPPSSEALVPHETPMTLGHGIKTLLTRKGEEEKLVGFGCIFVVFLTSLLCLVLFILFRGSCADTEAHAKHFDLRGIATVVLFSMTMARTHGDAVLHKSVVTYCEVICHYRMFH